MCHIRKGNEEEKKVFFGDSGLQNLVDCLIVDGLMDYREARRNDGAKIVE